MNQRPLPRSIETYVDKVVCLAVAADAVVRLEVARVVVEVLTVERF